MRRDLLNMKHNFTHLENTTLQIDNTSSSNFSLLVDDTNLPKNNISIAKESQTSLDDLVTDFWHFSRNTSICIYSIIIALLISFTMIRSFTFFSVCMRASTRLHDNMFDSITRATMRFFNTNSAGRILNRFSKDMGAIDELLPAAMIDCLQIGLSLLGIIVVVGVVSPWLMIPTFFIGILFYLMRIFYLRTSRSVKRLEGISKYLFISNYKLLNIQF